MSSNSFVLEVAVASKQDAILAAANGANRLELNMALELGGLTPTIGLLEDVREAVDIPVLAMVRPRAAGFRYSPAECATMLKDAERLLRHGADGLVAGALRDDGLLNSRFWTRLVQLAETREIVFHRAFDVVGNQFEVLEQLVDLGTTRILTSGGEATAWSGRQRLAELNRLAAGRIAILPGAGVSPDNAARLLKATGCDQLHGSFRAPAEDPAGHVAPSGYPILSPALVRQTRSVLDGMSSEESC